MQMTTMTSRLINWADLLFDFFLSVFSNIPSKRSREESVVITIAPLRSGFQYRNLQTSLMQPNKQTNETGQTPTKKNEKDQSDGRSLFQRLPTTFSIFFILLCFFLSHYMLFKLIYIFVQLTDLKMTSRGTGISCCRFIFPHHSATSSASTICQKRTYCVKSPLAWSFFVR